MTTLEHPDALAIAGASTASYALPNVESCAHAAHAPQSDARAYAQIAKAQVFADLGNTQAGLAALALVHDRGDRVLEAEAKLVEGDLRRAVDPRAAEAPLHAAAIAASAVGRLDLEAAAKILLVVTLAHSQLRLPEAERAADYAEAVVTPLGDPIATADYLYARSLAAWSVGGAERSLPIERMNLDVNIAVRGPDHPKVAEAMNSVAVSLVELERIAEALPLARRALAMRERLQGPDHPEALNARGNLAFALAEAGRIDEALALQERVAADRARVLGADYFLLSETWCRLAALYQWELGRTADALRAARRAHAIDEREFGAEAPEGLASLGMLARVLAAQGASAEAETTSAHALAIADAALPPSHLLVRTTLATRGFALARAGKCAEATAILDRLEAASQGAASGQSERVFGLVARARSATSGSSTSHRPSRSARQRAGRTVRWSATRWSRSRARSNLIARTAERAVAVRVRTRRSWCSPRRIASALRPGRDRSAARACGGRRGRARAASARSPVARRSRTLARRAPTRYRRAMKLLVLLVAAVPAVAAADVSIIDNGKTVAVDCAKDPQVSLIGNHLTGA